MDFLKKKSYYSKLPPLYDSLVQIKRKCNNYPDNTPSNDNESIPYISKYYKLNSVILNMDENEFEVIP